jgi:hypothetical protein
VEPQETNGTKVKETNRTFQYQTEWGPIYIPKTVTEKLGNPDRIKVTVEAAVTD